MPVDPEKINDLIVVPLQTQLSSHQYNAKEQFIKLDRESLKKIPFSRVYEDTSINNSIILLDEFRDAVNDLSVRLHYSCPNLGHEHGIDLFNNAAILPGKQFVSRYDDIELRVYSERPTSYLMICSDINKSPTLSLVCINLVKKCDDRNGNNIHSNLIQLVGKGNEKVVFLGFVTLHFNEGHEDSRILQSFTIQSFVLFKERGTLTTAIAAHTAASLYDTTIEVRLLQILQLLRYIKTEGEPD